MESLEGGWPRPSLACKDTLALLCDLAHTQTLSLIALPDGLYLLHDPWEGKEPVKEGTPPGHTITPPFQGDWLGRPRGPCGIRDAAPPGQGGL